MSLRTNGGTPAFNVGANSTLTVSAPITGYNNLTTPLNLQGSGLLLLTGSNAYLGATNISGGTLELGGGGLLSNGTAAANVANYSAAISNSGVLAVNTSANRTFSGVISGQGSLEQLGPGTLTLVTGGNTYHGATVVGGGALALTGTADINASSGITINGPTAKFLQLDSVTCMPSINLSQGTLDGTGTVGNVTVADLAANTLAAGNGSGGTLTTGNLTLNGAATFNLADGSMLNVGTLSVSNSGKTITVDAGQAAWTSGGTVGLIGYSNYDGKNFANFVMGTIGGLGARQTVALANNASAHQIDLVITGNSTYWTGTQSSAWTTNSSVLNWELTPANTSTSYIEGDSPTFDDRATGGTTVNITGGNVHPASVTFNNNNLPYASKSRAVSASPARQV